MAIHDERTGTSAGPEKATPPAAPTPPLNLAGKYALLEVPEFADCPERSAPMTSFVRLGIPNRHGEKDGGADLLSHARGAGWASELLDTRGGLRDHSDGDRIHTTRGHKVDVISGNYKKVLATDSGAGGSQREDHAHKDGRLELNTKRTNVVERTETTGERHESFQGPVYNKNIGVKQGTILSDGVLSQIAKKTDDTKKEKEAQAEPAAASAGEGGSGESEGASAEKDDSAEEEEEEEEEGDVGASVEAGATVGTDINAGLVMNEITAALAINTTTTAGLMTEQTLVGRSDSMTLAASMVETTWAGELHSVTSAMLMAESTNAVVLTSATKAAVMTDATIAGIIMSDTKAAMLLESTMIPMMSSVVVGDSIDLRVGNQVSVSVGTAFEGWGGAFTEIFIGAALSLRVAGSAEVTLGAAAEVFAGVAAEVFLGAKLEVNVANAVEISLGHKMEVDNTKEITAFTSTDTLATKIKKTASALFLGS